MEALSARFPRLVQSLVVPTEATASLVLLLWAIMFVTEGCAKHDIGVGLGFVNSLNSAL